MKLEEWNKEKVLDLFKKYRFNRFIERFNLQYETEEKDLSKLFTIEHIQEENKLKEVLEHIQKEKKLFYSFVTNDNEKENYIIKKNIVAISILDINNNVVYYYNIKNNDLQLFKKIFEDEQIELYGFELSHDYILLKQNNIEANNLKFDVQIVAYLLNPTISKYTLEGIANNYLGIDITEYLEKNNIKEEKGQIILIINMKNIKIPYMHM